jgi:hypothetical protein
MAATPEPYRLRLLSDGGAWRKGAWLLHRDSWTDFAEACEAAKAQAAPKLTSHGRCVRVTTGTSVKALAEFDGRTER